MKIHRGTLNSVSMNMRGSLDGQFIQIIFPLTTIVVKETKRKTDEKSFTKYIFEYRNVNRYEGPILALMFTKVLYSYCFEFSF